MNFSGMMRGLGAGIVNVGQMMKEQQKLDWETQQANLKYEREQHMAELNRKYQSAENKLGRDLTVSEAQKTRDAAAVENIANREMQGARDEADIAYKDKSLANQKQGLDNQAAESAAAAANRASSLELQRESNKSQAAHQSAMLNKESIGDTITKENYERLQGIAKEKFKDDKVAQDAFIFTTMTMKDKDGKGPPQEVVTKAMDLASEQIETMKNKDPNSYKQMVIATGGTKLPKSEQESRVFNYTVMHNIPSFYKTGSPEGSSAGGNSGQPAPKDTVDVREIMTLATQGDIKGAESKLLLLKAVALPNEKIKYKGNTEALKQYEDLFAFINEKKQENTNEYKPKAQNSMLGGGTGFNQ